LHNGGVDHDPDMDKVFRALADPGRRRLLDRLHENNGQTLGQLCGHLAMSRQAVTKHLKILEGALLVVPFWRGREKLHYLNPVPIHAIAERWIGKYQRGAVRALSELKQKLEAQEQEEGEPRG
jgi:DNA-binding transcriptional ArsR family regulator